MSMLKMMYYRIKKWEAMMRTTISVDNELYEKAMKYAGPDINNASELVREAIATYVRVEAAKRLADLGGAAPTMQDIPRRGDADPK